MKIKPYKQTLTHSCLVASLLMLEQERGGLKFGKSEEQQLALKGSQRAYPFYVVGVSAEVVKEIKSKIRIMVDNKYFTDILSKAFKTKKIIVEHQKVSVKLIKKLLNEGSLVCHVDTHALGDYSRASHFIVVESFSDDSFTIVDPWTGKRKRMNSKKLEEAIVDLKNKVKMAPLLFQLF